MKVDLRGSLNVFDFLKKYPNEKACEDFIIASRWPRGVNCPHCGNHKVYRLEKQKRFKCGSCRKQFTVRTGSVLAESKVSLQVWLMATWILTSQRKGISSVQLAKTLGVTQKTAWFLAHRIRETFNQGGRLGGPFDGVVEIDETYIGGKEKNKHKSKRLNAGRGTVGKIAVLGMKERGGRVTCMPVPDTSRTTLQGHIRKTITGGAILYTDDHSAYEGLLDYNHSAVRHSVGEYVNGMASTNGIESFWALLKRGFYGIYHKMSPAHLGRYVDEFSFRHNTAKYSDEVTFAMAFYLSNGRRLTYKELKGAA